VEERRDKKRKRLDPEGGDSAAGERPVESEGEGNEEGGELTKSQIKNRAKKAKQAKKEGQKSELKIGVQGSEVTTEETGGSQVSAPVKKVNGTKTTESHAKVNRSEVSSTISEIELEKVEVNGVATTSEESATKTSASRKKVNGTKTNESRAKINGREIEPPIPTLPINSSASNIPVLAAAVLSTSSNVLPPASTHPSTTSPVPVLTNGIKSTPSNPRRSTSRSPSIAVISSPAPAVPSPTSMSELRARLTDRIAQSRIARKALGTKVPGAPQTREAILQARARRKALVQAKIKAKKATATQEEKTLESESSDEKVPMSGVSFGRVIVGTEEVDVARGEVKSVKKRKGPSDVKGRLAHLEAKEARLETLDPEKKKKAMENDRWHHALLAARGEKVKDNVSLLKKTISRKEKDKKKSKREWDDRLAKVEHDKEERQRKREENLAKRREEKGKKGKKVKGKKPIVKKKRPGFEGGRVKMGRK
jgi:Surfeit locus protein 6